jgi:methionyl-tRNA synthetase
MSRPYYLTTAIHYVNDLPHIGHIYENVTADVVARFHRLIGDDVYFLTGTDEHGQKIERSAAREGISPIELADRVVAVHHELWKKLDISHDDFIRTTEPRHRDAVYEVIRRIKEKNPGDIYQGEHSGWYCSSEETFIPESQVKNGKCEEGHPVEMTTERNYFFKLSAYTQPLLDFYAANPEFVQPSTRFNEVKSFVQGGLKDLSISRSTIKWGIPFPGDPEHVIYVWMDALTNYISALGFGSGDDTLFKKHWPNVVHIIGKDIVRFHAVYWPAFLMSAGVEPPRQIQGHGWWLRDNQKISKSTGNVVRPEPIIDQFGSDAFRFFLIREMVFGQDASYSDESFVTRYNSDLANDFGNTLSRIIKMSDSYFDGKTPPVPCDDNDLNRAAEETVPAYLAAMESFAFQRAMDVVWKFLDAINSYIVAKEPWKKFKETGADEALSRILWNTLESFRIVSIMLSPVMPRISSEALNRLGAPDTPLTRDSLAWGGLKNGVAVRATDPLFPRIDIASFLGTEAKDQKGTKVSDQTEVKTEQPQTSSEAPKGTPPAETTEAIAPDANQISIDEFFKADLRVAQVKEAERVEKSKKLIKMRIDTGDGERTIVAGIATAYAPEDLVGRKVIIVANLKPAKLMGIESQGMVLAASLDGEPSLVAVDPSVPLGTKVK